MPRSEIIELLDVSVAPAHTTDTVVLRSVTWTICEGDFWAVGGLPGCGKSSLLATAAGLSRPTEGVCRLFGRDVADLGTDELARERLRVGVVFPNEGRLFQQLTVAENVALPLAYHRNLDPGDAVGSVLEILKRLGLDSLADRLPGRILPQMRHRVALARALALEPEILFLDDPLRGLDRREVRWWSDFLRGLNEGGFPAGGRRMTLVVAANDLQGWVDLAEKFGLINSSRWTLLGGRDELKARTEPLLRELLVDDLT
jgi:ABC-type transporter Mla maintaining outer membrane lipid asymmetry ATPase subunit MlaF